MRKACSALTEIRISELSHRSRRRGEISFWDFLRKTCRMALSTKNCPTTFVENTSSTNIKYPDAAAEKSKNPAEAEKNMKSSHPQVSKCIWFSHRSCFCLLQGVNKSTCSLTKDYLVE